MAALALILAVCAVICLTVAIRSGAVFPLVVGAIEIVAAGCVWLGERLS